MSSIFEEPSSSSSNSTSSRPTIMKFCCFLQGDSTPFLVAIKLKPEEIPYFNIAQLKKPIYEEIKDDYPNFDSKNLVLWKTELPMSEIQNLNAAVSLEKFGKKLDATELITEAFSNIDFSKARTIHIIVERPPAPQAQKRKAKEELSEQLSSKLKKDSSPSKKVRLFIRTEGPVNVENNFIVPFEELGSYTSLIEHVNNNRCPLLVGHFQSGITSTLKYLSQRMNWFHISSAELSGSSTQLLKDISRQIHLPNCENIENLSDFGYYLDQEYSSNEIVLMFDEFDYFCSRKDTADSLGVLKSLVKSVSNGTFWNIKSIICAGSFALTKLIKTPVDENDENDDVVVNENESDEDVVLSDVGDNNDGEYAINDADAMLDKDDKIPPYVPSPWNTSSVIEASDFTWEQHLQFFQKIQDYLDITFEDQIIKDIYSHTQGYPGLEGLLALMCMQRAVDQDIMFTYKTWLSDFTEFTRYPTRRRMTAIGHIKKYLAPDSTINKKAIKLLEKFLRYGTIAHVNIAKDELKPLLRLRSLGIIKQNRNNEFIFTSSLICDLLSSEYYPIYDNLGSAKINDISDPEEFLTRIFQLMTHIRHETIYNPLAANAHTFSEYIIQGELLAILRAVAYPTYKVYCECNVTETQTKCDIWLANGIEVGIEVMVGKVSKNEIKANANQLIGYTKGREKTRSMFLFNFVPDETVSRENGKPSLPFPSHNKPPKKVYFEIVHILYSRGNREATIFRKDKPLVVVPFASE